MAGLVPAIHDFLFFLFATRHRDRPLPANPWMAGTRPAMTIGD
jgi:hypothetical protein